MIWHKSYATATLAHCHSNTPYSWNPEAVGDFLDETVVPIHPDEDSRQLQMLASLHFSFPQWYGQLARDFRIAYNRGQNQQLFVTDAQKKDWFVVNTSRITGRDLRGFFDKWNLDYSEHARLAVMAMNLPFPIRASYEHVAELVVYANGAQRESVVQGTIAASLANNVGLVAYDQQVGPTSLMWTENDHTRLTVTVTDEQSMPFNIRLRGEASHGACARYGINAAYDCASADNSLDWRITYIAAENTNLPPGRYRGTLQLAARDWRDKEWGAQVRINLDITQPRHD